MQLTSPGTVPQLYFWGYQVSQPQAPLAEPYLLLFTPDEENAVAASLLGPDAGTYSPESPAVVGFQVFDCNGAPAPGVTGTIDVRGPDTRQYYSTSALSVSVTAVSTGASGIGGFIYVPPGIVNLTATPVSLGKVVSRVTVLARAGTITTVFMSPTL